MNDSPEPGIVSSFLGRTTRRLETAHCWIEVLALGGPRIVGFGLTGGESILAETPDACWDAGYGIYELVGGHRLWFAPESPECSYPDSDGLTLSALPGLEDGEAGVRLVGAFETPTGLRREMKIRLEAASASAVIRHVLRNEGQATHEVSVWPITQLKLGGVARVELPAPNPAHAMKPGQLIALWPYASWADDRLTITERSITVAATPGRPFKLGCWNSTGFATYQRDGVLFRKSFDPAAQSEHADMGCNVEIYCGEGAIEVESLGPLTRLVPGDSVTFEERWDLSRVG